MTTKPRTCRPAKPGNPDWPPSKATIEIWMRRREVERQRLINQLNKARQEVAWYKAQLAAALVQVAQTRAVFENAAEQLLEQARAPRHVLPPSARVVEIPTQRAEPAVEKRRAKA